MAMTPQDWTISGLSVELGVDRRTLAKRLADIQPVRDDGKAKYYRMRDVVDALVLNNAATGSYEEEKTRLTKAQANHEELKVEVLKGELIRAEVVERVQGGMVSAFRARCLSLPVKASPQLVGLDESAIESALADYVYEALEELSDFDPGAYIPQSGAAGEAATQADDQPVGGLKPGAESRGKRRTRTLAH